MSDLETMVHCQPRNQLTYANQLQPAATRGRPALEHNTVAAPRRHERSEETVAMGWAAAKKKG
jgi:hypothetical protein